MPEADTRLGQPGPRRPITRPRNGTTAHSRAAEGAPRPALQFYHAPKLNTSPSTAAPVLTLPLTQIPAHTLTRRSTPVILASSSAVLSRHCCRLHRSTPLQTAALRQLPCCSTAAAAAAPATPHVQTRQMATSPRESPLTMVRPGPAASERTGAWWQNSAGAASARRPADEMPARQRRMSCRPKGRDDQEVVAEQLPDIQGFSPVVASLLARLRLQSQVLAD